MIDHIFMLVESNGLEIKHLESLGLVETYRRTHRGQGTRNICYCFDNLFLEMLWVDDAAEVQGEAIRRTGVYERSLWRSNGACPFGIAVRPSQPGLSALPSTWRFTPPYLPAGMSIAVATDSDDPQQPMMFESPGSTPPADWAAEKRGRLQHNAGLGAVTRVALTMPANCHPSGALQTIATNQVPPLLLDHSGPYRLCLWVASLDDATEVQIVLPRQAL